MSNFRIDITNRSGEKGTIDPDIGFSYSDMLNEINEGNIKISSLGTVRRGLIEMGSTIEIYRNNSLEFKGYVDSKSSLDGGGIYFHVSGKEARMAKEKGSYPNSPYTSTASATIASDIIGESNYFTTGTIEAGLSIDFRSVAANSLWNELTNLIRKTGQDIQIDYANDEIDVLNQRGSSTSIATLTDGIDFENMQYDTTLPSGNKVIVYGKGDGVNQIKSEYPSHGYDATSQSTYGVIERPVIERSIISVSEANQLADIEVAITKDETEIYDFDMINPNINFTTGDVITIHAPDKDAFNKTVRIVSKVRGRRGNKEFLELQVVNTAYRQAVLTKEKYLAKMVKSQRDSDTYMQGSGNTLTWSNAINAKSGAPMQVIFQIPQSFIEDEAGNIRVNNMTVDYDVDPYKKGVGTAGESNVAPSLPSMTSSTNTIVSVIGSDSVSSYSLTGGSWDTNILSQSVSGTYGVLWASIIIGYDSGSNTPDLILRIKNDTLPVIYFPIVESFHSNIAKDAYSAYIPISLVHSGSTTFNLDLYATSTIDVDINMYVYGQAAHSHSISGYNAENHNHSVSIGDGVSDAGSVNASEVDIYLDYWNGSSWVNKHSILNTGKTLDTDVDITNSGTYPDTYGYWRIRIEPDNASPDYVQGIVKLKHSLDN